MFSQTKKNVVIFESSYAVIHIACDVLHNYYLRDILICHISFVLDALFNIFKIFFA